MTNEDTSDNDTDEMITYKTDELKKSNRKNINTAKKKGRAAKIYTMNIERKRLLKQRRERTLLNAKDATGKPNTYVFDPTDVPIHEFFFQGEPNPKDLEGVEEDKILEIHRTSQQKIKERDAEREKYYKKDTRIRTKIRFHK